MRKNLKKIEREEIIEGEDYIVVANEWERYGNDEACIEIVKVKGSEVLDLLGEYDEDDFVGVYEM